jgi:hypothetical protein
MGHRTKNGTTPPSRRQFATRMYSQSAIAGNRHFAVR